MNTYNTCIPQISGEFLCSQAHIFFTWDQPDPKDKFSPIKKYEILIQFDTTAPLNYPDFRNLPLRSRSIWLIESEHQVQTKTKMKQKLHNYHMDKRTAGSNCDM